MHKKWYIMVAVLCVALIAGTAGCAKKHVRHLASDVCLITPEVSTKEQVITYLGTPDEQYEMADGTETWFYYEVRKSLLNNTPYVGDQLGDKKYETIKVTFAGDVVQTCFYRSLSEEEFQQDRLTE
jgi:hypothetical protein